MGLMAVFYNPLIHQYILARPERFELPTPWFEAKCSIQMSYGRFRQIILGNVRQAITCRAP